LGTPAGGREDGVAKSIQLGRNAQSFEGAITMASFRLFSTLALAGVLDELLPGFRDASVETTLLPTALLAERIRAGEAADVAILMADMIDALIAERILRPGRTDLARSRVGIAVRTGARKPDISTVEDFVAAMHAARSVALSRAGASGVSFAQVLRRLGIADDINAKAIVIPSGFTGELVARGEAEMAVQQISELMVVPGIELVGALPPGIECISVFSAGIFAGTPVPVQAQSLIALLRSAEAGPVFKAKGLEPLR
jgi:molybdate transport system substrate-binding protein